MVIGQQHTVQTSLKSNVQQSPYALQTVTYISWTPVTSHQFTIYVIEHNNLVCLTMRETLLGTHM